MAEKTTDVAVKEFQLPSTDLNLGEAMAEEMDGLEFRFDVVKIPSGGGLAFEIPGDDPTTRKWSRNWWALSLTTTRRTPTGQMSFPGRMPPRTV